MYFSNTLTLLPLLALRALAQTDSSSASAPATTPTDSITSTSTSLSPTATCLSACPSGDVNCAASCAGVPYPNTAQVNQTNECANSCVQGDGSKSQSDEYAKCMAGCISSYYMSMSSTGGASGGAGVVTVTGTNSKGEPTTSTSTKSGEFLLLWDLYLGLRGGCGREVERI